MKKRQKTTQQTKSDFLKGNIEMKMCNKRKEKEEYCPKGLHQASVSTGNVWCLHWPTLGTLPASTGNVWCLHWPTLGTLPASTGNVWCLHWPTLGTLPASTGNVWCLHWPTLGTLPASTGNVWCLHRPTLGTLPASTGNVWCLHRPTLGTLPASTGNVWCLHRPTLGTLPASTGNVWCLHRPTLGTLSVSTGNVWCLHRPTLGTLSASTDQHSARSQHPQGMCGASTDQHSARSQPPQGMWGAETAPLSTRSDPPQGMCGAGQPHSRHALRFHRVCAVQVSPTLDTLCASTGYVRCRSAPLSTRSAPPQGMCGAGQPHSRHALRLHRVYAVQVSPTLDTLCASTGYVRCRDRPTLDTLWSSTGYVRCRSAPLSTRSALPQGMCGAGQPHSRHALRLHRVCAVQVSPTLDTLCASIGLQYVRCRSAPLSTRSALPQGMWGAETAPLSTRSDPPQGMCGAGQPHSRHALRFHRVCAVQVSPTLDTLCASTGYVRCRVSPTLDTLCASTGYVRCRSAPLSTRSALPQGMWGAETAPLSTRSAPPQGMCGAGQPHSRHALRLHRVCAVQVSPTLDTLCASTGYVRCRDRPTLDTLWSSTGYVRCRSAPLSTRSALPQGMCGAGQPHSRHALRLHRVCAVQVSPTLDTLCASTGYVRCRSAPLSTRSALPQGMCGAGQPHSRHALRLHRVCAVQVSPTLDTLCASTGYVRCRSAPLSTRSAPPQGMCGASPHSRHALRLHRVCAVQVSPTLDTLCASTGYVRCRSAPLSTRSAPPQGVCGASQLHSRHALRLHRVCAVQVSSTLDTLCASTGCVRCKSAPLSTRSAPPQGVCGAAPLSTRSAPPQGMCGAIQPHSRQLCASTGYVRCGSAPLSTRSAPPQGMCGAGQPHSRHALRLHHVLS